MILKCNDFDLAKKMGEVRGDDSVLDKYSLMFSSPQRIDEGEDSFKHDWWSAGVILFWLCSKGKFPFDD